MKRRLRTGHKGFTLTEVMIALGGLLILGTIAAMGYQALIDDAKETVCATNLKALTSAIELYVDEYGAVPTVLGDLKFEHLDKAYAKVMGGSDWHTRFAHRFLEMNLSSEAYGAFLSWKKLKKFGVRKNMFVCPENEGEACSYGINGNLTRKKWTRLRNKVLIVGDCGRPVFHSEEDLKRRHRSGQVAVAVTKGKKVKKKRKNERLNSDEIDAAAVDADDDGDVDASDLI